MPLVPHAGPTGVELAKVARISTVLAWGCLGVAVLVPLVVASAWLFAPPETLNPALRAAGRGAHGDLSPWQRAAGLGLSLLHALLMSRALWLAQLCFRRFARGVFFDHRNVAGLRGFAGYAFASTLAAIVVAPLTGMLLGLARAPGQLTLSIGIESAQILGLLISGTVWVMAHVMARAVALADENAAFV